MSRIIPLSGTEQDRQNVAGLILDDEIHTTSDQRRFFVQNVVVAPVWHGEVADEAAMLNLRNYSVRGCWAGDRCKRTDDPTATEYLCITRNGQEAQDWVRISKAVQWGEIQDIPLTFGGRWEPVANGDVDNPEIVFSDGDVVMSFVED